MLENIRLVIWDLDDTFWRGTVSEGRYEYVQDHHEIIVQLASRGIISSICSRNNKDEVEGILKGRGIWDFFVFPSMDWSAIGGRIKAIVEASQLRPATILFIDDDLMNLAEAERWAPGIQVADPSIISSISTSPLFQGKDDSSLSRLEKYKILEKRAKDKNTASDMRDFLCKSGIRVIIDHDIENNIDRAIDLINDTDRLNFTKRRLHEDRDAAKKELRNLIGGHWIQSGLVRVVDNYGDYGFIGIYVHRTDIEGPSSLLHYCFSCLALGMQVETWLYQRLRRPYIEIQGDVLTDITDSSAEIDWIQQQDGVESNYINVNEIRDKTNIRFFVRGGCETQVVAHYLGLIADNIVTEFTTIRDGMHIRCDSSQMLRISVKGPTDLELESLKSLGYTEADFNTALKKGNGESEVWLFSMAADILFMNYRHRTLGFRVPLGGPIGERDLTKCDLHQVSERLGTHPFVSAIAEVKKNYDFDDLTSAEAFCEAMGSALKELPKGSRAFILAPSEYVLTLDGTLQNLTNIADFNREIAIRLKSFDGVSLLPMDGYVHSDEERVVCDPIHFARQVYFRIFEDVRDRTINGRQPTASS